METKLPEYLFIAHSQLYILQTHMVRLRKINIIGLPFQLTGIPGTWNMVFIHELLFAS